MGLIRATLTLANPRDASRSAMQVEALVDTGALHLCVPEHVALQLGLTELEQREVTLADGKKRSYSGPVLIEYQGRHCFTGALVMGDEPLLGAIPMKDMDLVIHPATRQRAANPASPNIPSAVVKTVKN